MWIRLQRWKREMRSCTHAWCWRGIVCILDERVTTMIGMPNAYALCGRRQRGRRDRRTERLMAARFGLLAACCILARAWQAPLCHRHAPDHRGPSMQMPSLEDALAAVQRRVRNTLGCETCRNTRAVPCPNCDGVGGYEAMGGTAVPCKACRATGKVVCRDCFVGDPWDIEQIRRDMGVPD